MTKSIVVKPLFIHYNNTKRFHKRNESHMMVLPLSHFSNKVLDVTMFSIDLITKVSFNKLFRCH